MATFYIQLENRLLQISGELTAENISKALGYVPVSPNVTNELSQRVDNITFDSLKDNPFLQDGSGELNIVDEAGNIIAKVSSEGIRTIEVLAGEHRLSEKANKSDLPTKLSDLDNDTNYITLADIPPVEIPSLDEYVTEEELNNKGYITQHQDISHLATKAEVSDIDFYNIKNNPVINSETGKLLFVDESGNIGLQLENNGLYVSNVFAGSHVLSNKADKSEVPTSTSQLTNDSGYITKPVVDQAIASLVDSAPETLDTIGEIASALKNNANIVDVLNQSISAKQNTIEDLEAIRAGASLGATALQEIPEEYVTRDEIPNLPSLDEYAKKEDIPSLNGYATQAWVNNKNYATEEDLSSIEFNSLQNNPLVEDSNGEFNLVDDLGNVGFKVNQEGLFVKDVIAGEHKLSEKVDIVNMSTINGQSLINGGDIVVGGKEPYYFNISNIDNFINSCFDFTNLIEAHKLGRPIFLRDNVNDYVLPEDLVDLYDNNVIPVSVVYNSLEIHMSFIYAEKLYYINFIVSDIGTYCSDEQSITIIPIDSIYAKPNAGIPKSDLSTEVQELLDETNSVFIDVPLDDIDFEEDGFGNLDIGLIQFTLQEDYNTLKQAVIDGKQLAISYAITSDISTPTYLYDLWIDDMIYGKIAHPYTGMIYDVEISLGGISFSKVAKVTSNGIAAKDLYFEENNDSSISIKEALSRKQDKLTSGTNIKTINGESILGSGDITISGGSSTTPMRYSTPAASIIIPMNVAKVITSVTSTNQTFILGTNLTVITNPVNFTQEQKWEIVFAINASLSTAPTITFNTGGIGTIYWINGTAPTFEVGKFYEVSFLNAGGILLGVCAEFSAAS